MTPTEWEQVKDEVAALWGKNSRWANAADAYRHAKNVPAAAAFQAVELIYLENRKMTPAPADVLGAARKFITDTLTTEDVARTCAQAGHRWGIVSESSGVRTVVCSRCMVEETRAAHLAPTDSELEDGTFSGKGVDTTERIAP